MNKAAFPCRRCQKMYASKDAMEQHWEDVHDLYRLKASELNTFVQKQLQPETPFLASCGKAVNNLVLYLENTSLRYENLTPREVIKGGSLGKGTAVDEMSDIDLVIFLNKYHHIPTLRNDMDSILIELKEYLGQKYHVTGKTNHAVTVQIPDDVGDMHEVDVLPTCKLPLDSKADRKTVYEEVGPQSSVERYFYSVAFVNLQVDFVKNSCTKLKELIRVVKYWRKTHFEETSRRTLPSSYLLELICIHVWEDKSGEPDFDLREMLHSVISTLANYSSLKAEWFANYDKSVAQTFRKPYVVDPANPFNNVADCDTWPEVAKEAKAFLQKPLFEGMN